LKTILRSPRIAGDVVFRLTGAAALSRAVERGARRHEAKNWEHIGVFLRRHDLDTPADRCFEAIDHIEGKRHV